jgi:hypothetical protein
MPKVQLHRRDFCLPSSRREFREAFQEFVAPEDGSGFERCLGQGVLVVRELTWARRVMSSVPLGSTNRLNSCSEPQVEDSTRRGSSARPNRLRMVAVEWSRSAENVELPSLLAVPSATDRRCPAVPTTRKTEPRSSSLRALSLEPSSLIKSVGLRSMKCRITLDSLTSLFLAIASRRATRSIFSRGPFVLTDVTHRF